eukprot:4567879-Pleurochrysis_carterae.AAC.1
MNFSSSTTFVFSTIACSCCEGEGRGVRGRGSERSRSVFARREPAVAEDLWRLGMPTTLGE